MRERTVGSFKLRPFDEHAWIVPRDATSGVTLRGEDARRAFALGAALFELASPGAPERVRALSVDLERARLLATIEVAGAKPRAVRVDGPRVRAAVSPALLEALTRAVARLPRGEDARMPTSMREESE
jgi:hypothetical protein